MPFWSGSLRDKYVGSAPMTGLGHGSGFNLNPSLGNHRWRRDSLSRGETIAKLTEVHILSAHQSAVGEGNRGPGIDERVCYLKKEAG